MSKTLSMEEMERHHILDNDALDEIADATPYQEGGDLEDFMSEVETIAQALKSLPQPKNARHKALYLMRAFYLLGVKRGAGEYRNSILIELGAEDIFNETPFALSEWCAGDFCEELRDYPETVRELCATLGI